MSIRAGRLSSAESRAAALDAARTLLIEGGPQALTLKAVAARIGRTHANLLHHFGSAAGLQRALIAWMAESITRSIGNAVQQARRDEIDPRAIVDLTFDAFAREGAAALVYQLILSGERDALDPVLDAIGSLVEEIGPDQHPVREATLALILSAIGDALIGEQLTGKLALPREASRTLALRQLLAAVP